MAQLVVSTLLILYSYTTGHRPQYKTLHTTKLDQAIVIFIIYELRQSSRIG